MYKRIIKKLVILTLLTSLFSVIFTPSVFSATVATYSDSGCGTASSTFDEGTTVYARATGVGPSGNLEFRYIDFGSTQRCMNAYVGGGNQCDSTGCYLDPSYQEGTWEAQFWKDSLQDSSITFTVNVVLPEFPNPIGLMVGALLWGASYLFMRKNLVKQ